MTHTVRPEKLAPMLPDLEYTITIKVQRMVRTADSNAVLANLYRRATMIASARCRDFARAQEGVHHWIGCHAWRTLPAGTGTLAFAVVMMGLSRPGTGGIRHAGLAAPTLNELMSSGGATIEEVQQRSPQRATEVLVEFDHRDPAATSAPLFMYSYGERVTTHTVDSFEPFVQRAENHARAHQKLFDLPGTSERPFSVGHQEWYIAESLVTVELHLTP